MRKTSIAWTMTMLAAAGTAVGAYALAKGGNATRADCPGTIVCPLTGEAVCRDECPLTDGARDASPVSPCCGGSVDATTPHAKPAAKKGCCP